MIKCVNDNCDYFNANGECSSACEHNGYKKILTNADRIKEYDIDAMAQDRINMMTRENCDNPYYPVMYHCSDGYATDNYEEAQKHESDWLKQPAEESEGK